ncbi:MAG: TolC family protein [Candidatus Omnitrophica bacterium]|nr:TolC family protein [Candidatus Omnitrophota bacterium]
MKRFVRKLARVLVIFIVGYGFLVPTRVPAAGIESPQGNIQLTDSQPPAQLPELRLEDLIQEALKRNPDMIAAKAEWLAAKKRVLQAWALPDPKVGMDVMGEMVETRVGPEENRMVVAQQIPFPLKLWERRKAAKEAAKVAEQQYYAVRRDILWQLKSAYYKLYRVDASTDVIRETHELLKKTEKVAESRYASKSAAQRDVAKAQAEVSLSLEQIYMLQQNRESLVAKINALLDRDPLGGLGKTVKPEKPELKMTLIEIINLAVKHRPEVNAGSARKAQSRHEKTLAQMENLPDLDMEWSYTWVKNGTTDDPDDGKNSWMIPLRINVPLWQNRIIPAIQEAQKKVEAAEASLGAAKNLTFYEVKDAYVRYQAAAQIVLLYETAVIPQAELALRSDQSGYESGSTDFLNLLDSERVFLNTKLNYVKFYAEALKGTADLERAAGIDLTGGTS